jgi:hypothetical protein
LDLLIDIWCRLTSDVSYIEKELNWSDFLVVNFINADKKTAIKSGKLLLCAMQLTSENFKKTLLRSLIEVLPRAVDCCRFPAGMNQLFSLLYLCWDTDRGFAHLSCVKVILPIFNVY